MGEQDRTLVIIGAGRLGVAVARTILRAGRHVVIANSRGPDSLASVVSMLGERATAGTVEQAGAAGINVPTYSEAFKYAAYDGLQRLEGRPARAPRSALEPILAGR